MKYVLKKSYLLGLSLLVFSVVGFLNVSNGAGVEINTNPVNLHESTLYWLYLSGIDNNEDSWLNVSNASVGQKFLSVLNGLIIGNNHDSSDSQYVAIGGGFSNRVGARYAGIGGGQGNIVMQQDGVIGGGLNNNVDGKGGAVVGGEQNMAKEFGVVVGGLSNEDSGTFGVVLGGNNNTAGSNGLALGQNSNGGTDSFVWNQEAGNGKAGINASNGVLIGTYNAKQSVALVVNGAVKLGKDQEPDVKGEIDNRGGCIKVNDGTSIHVLGKTSESESQCGAGKGCQFGKTILQHGDVITTTNSVVKAYKKPYSTNCAGERIYVRCDNGNLRSDQSSMIYSYCYRLDPIATF